MNNSKAREGQAITLSIVTATYNAALVLPRLIASLQAQTDIDFEWVVADGASTDKTLELLEQAGRAMNIRVDSRPDFGIYDALNRAVKLANGEYYLVMGADDELFSDAVARYKLACVESGSDMVTAMIEVDGKECGVRKYQWEWLYGQFAYVSGHAVGLVIRRDLHDKFGWYSRMFPIAADQFFVLQAIHGGSSVNAQSFIAGKFCTEGISGKNVIHALVDGFNVQVAVGLNVGIQLGLLALRVLKNYSRVKKTILDK